MLSPSDADRREINVNDTQVKAGWYPDPGNVDPDYSYRAVARLSRRGQDTTWPAMAQKS